MFSRFDPRRPSSTWRSVAMQIVSPNPDFWNQWAWVGQQFVLTRSTGDHGQVSECCVDVEWGGQKAWRKWAGKYAGRVQLRL